MMTERYGTRCPPASEAKRSPKTGTGRWNVAASGFAPTGRQAGHPRDEGADPDGHDAPGQVALEAHPAEVGQHHDGQRGQADNGVGERAEQKAERDEAERDAGKRREERGAWRGLAHTLGDKRCAKFDETGDERREQAGLPRHERRIGRTAPLGECLCREHDQKHMGEERDRVDAVGQRADVGAAGAFGQPPCLNGVGDVPHHDRNRCRRQHPAVDKLGWEPEHASTERVDQEELNQIVEREAEKPVDVAANDPIARVRA